MSITLTAHPRGRVTVAALAAGLLALSACSSTDPDETPEQTSDAPAATTDAADSEQESDRDPAPGASGDFDGYAEAVVTTEWLEDNLDNPDIAIIEVSTEPGVYERGHIPGAVNFVWHTDFVDTVTRDIVAQDTFTDLVQAAGVDEDTTVILYGDRNNWFSAWGAWVFELYGAQDVRLLDGGRVAWEDEGRPLEVAAPSPQPGNFTAAQADAQLRAFLPDVLEIANGEADYPLVDIRSADEFNGVIFAPEGFQELAVRAGHIPNAVNVPWVQAVAEDGRFKPVEELRQIYAEVGVDGTKPVVVYCRIGERASHTWFVLHRLLGYDVALYDGSWTEYGNAVGVPVNNPAGTVFGGS